MVIGRIQPPLAETQRPARCLTLGEASHSTCECLAEVIVDRCCPFLRDRLQAIWVSNAETAEPYITYLRISSVSIDSRSLSRLSVRAAGRLCGTASAKTRGQIKQHRSFADV